MANMHYTITVAVDPDVLEQWTEHRDSERLPQEARATVRTSSIRDWLMSDIAGHREFLGLQSLDWLANEIEAPSRTTEHLDSRDYWWFVWILYPSSFQASIDDLDRLLRHAREQPQRFGATAEDVRAAYAWDQGCDALDFDIPNVGEGDDPMYVLCSILALRRLVTLAQSHGLPVVHMRYSYRA